MQDCEAVIFRSFIVSDQLSSPSETHSRQGSGSGGLGLPGQYTVEIVSRQCSPKKLYKVRTQNEYKVHAKLCPSLSLTKLRLS